MKFSSGNILKLIRPEQYVKNLFIFAPLFFAGQFVDLLELSNVIVAFVAFSFSASGIYVFNDYQDINADREHPKKKNRPLASGVISKLQAVFIMFFLFVLGFSIMALVSTDAVKILVAYVALNVAYCLSLKHIAILDITIISIGFVLRLFVGATVAEVSLSKWIVVITFLLALFMALAKRRDDVLIFLETGKKMRKVVDGYNLHFLDTAMAIMASVVIVAYIMFTTSVEVIDKFHNQHLYLTSLFVTLGIMRYLKIALVNLDSGSPTKIVLRDSFMQSVLVAWVFSFILIIY